MSLSRLAARFREQGLRGTAVRAWSRATQTLEVTAQRLRGAAIVETRYGVRMRANWNDATFRFCYFGSYGRALADILDARREPFVFLDIGANQGLYSLIAARNTACRSVLAFEPVPSTFELLSANVSVDACARSKSTCVRAGITAEKRTQEIFIDPAHSGLSSLRRNHARQGMTQSIELISHHELEELLRKHAPPELDLVAKIDVEGHEEIVAAELLKLPSSDRLQTIFYEVDARWTSQAAIRSPLEAAGFGNFVTIAAGSHHDVLATRGRGRSLSPQSAMTAS